MKEAIESQGAAIKEQHQESREYMKDLMLTHVGILTKEQEKTNKTIEEHVKTLYPMIREVRENIIDAKIAKALADNSELKWVKGFRRFAIAIISALVITSIIGGVSVGIRLYDMHNLSQPASVKGK